MSQEPISLHQITTKPVGLDQGFSMPQFCIPAVLVVGDYKSKDNEHFVLKTWNAVKNAYESRERLWGEPVGLEDLTDACRFAPFPKQKEIVERNDATALYPVAFHDGGNTQAKTFQPELHRAFLNYDVWAVIACTTSRNTPALLDALDFIDVPIFLAVDSALLGVRARSNIRRLIPSNINQAQVMIAKLAEKTKGTDMDSPVEVLFHPAGDRYVSDILKALKEQIVGRPRDILLRNTPDIDTALARDRKKGILVCLGYEAAVAETLKVFDERTSSNGSGTSVPKRDCEFTILFSDGCYGSAKVRKQIHDKKCDHPRSQFLWTHSLFDSSAYATFAYVATCDAWLTVGRRTHWERRGARSLKVTLSPFINQVEARLAKNFGSMHYFQGIENQRASYVIDEIFPNMDSQADSVKT